MQPRGVLKVSDVLDIDRYYIIIEDKYRTYSIVHTSNFWIVEKYWRSLFPAERSDYTAFWIGIYQKNKNF